MGVPPGRVRAWLENYAEIAAVCIPAGDIIVVGGSKVRSRAMPGIGRIILKADLDRAIGLLPARERYVVVAYYIHGRPIEHVARALRRSERTAWRILRDGVVRIAQILSCA